MRRVIPLVFLAATATTAAGSGSQAAGRAAVNARTPTALAVVPAYVEGFGQDGDRVVWATETGPCGRRVVLRTLSTGRSTILAGRKRPHCVPWAGGVQPWMALAGTRALWAHMSPSLSHYNHSLFTSAPGDRAEHELADMSIDGGLSDEGGQLHPVPMAGHGRTLVYADINTDGGRPSGVYRVVGQRARHVRGTEAAFAVAVVGARFALARAIPAGCVCNTQPIWSPDGRQIAFRSGSGGGTSIEQPLQLLVMDADGTNARKVLDKVLSLAWAPDGSSLAAWQAGGTAHHLVVVKPDGTGARTLARIDGSFAWAPDGRHLAYGTGGRALVVSTDGGAAVDLGASTDEVAWSPDSQRLAYSREIGADTFHVFVVSVANGSTRDIGSGRFPSWAPDGSAVAFAGKDGVYVAAPDGSNARPLAPAVPRVGPFWSPDGHWIAFADTGAVWIVAPQGGPPRKLVTRADADIEWSPDSQALLYSDYPVTGVVDVATGTRRFTIELFDDLLPDWSPDSNRLVGIARGGEVAQVDAHTGTQVMLTHTRVTAARTFVGMYSAAGVLRSSFEAATEARSLAWGGSRFALLRWRSKTQSTIEIRDTRGTLLRQVNVPRPWFDQLSMSGDSIVFRAGDTVRLLDASTGAGTVLARSGGGSLVGLSIDGRRVAWAESTRTRSVIRAVLLPRCQACAPAAAR